MMNMKTTAIIILVFGLVVTVITGCSTGELYGGNVETHTIITPKN